MDIGCISVNMHDKPTLHNRRVAVQKEYVTVKSRVHQIVMGSPNNLDTKQTKNLHP